MDLRSHVLNAASIETSRGFRLAKEQQRNKIDAAVALSFAVTAAGQSERPLDPDELRNYKPVPVDSNFDPLLGYW